MSLIFPQTKSKMLLFSHTLYILQHLSMIKMTLYLFSVFTDLGVVFNDVYTASKFAMEGFCESMAVQLMKFNVR